MTAAAALRQALADRHAVAELGAAVDEALAAWHAGDVTSESIARLDAAMTALEDLRANDEPAVTTAAPADPPQPAAAPPAPRRPDPSPEGQAGAEPPPSGQKRCGTCKETKPVAEFSRHRRSKDGLQNRCKPCHREAVRTSQRKKAAGTKTPSSDGDKEGSQVPVIADRPSPAPAPPATDERVCTGCAKTLPLAAFRAKPAGRSRKCMVCDGADRVDPMGPMPSLGPPAFVITLTCSACDLADRSTHPQCDDQDAIAEAWRRVEQALHDCPGDLTATVSTDVEPPTGGVTVRQQGLVATALSGAR